VSTLLPLFVPNATWHDGPCAEVRVGDHAIRYVRRGTGPSIVVVSDPGDSHAMWRRLVESLAPSHRIFLTQPPPAGVDVMTWLRGFIEGIGLASIILIAGGASGAAAMEVAAVDDFTVRKLILLPVDGSDGTADYDAWPADAPENFLALTAGSAEESLRRIERFIATDDAA
jgi:pimeloyl-ACP methyl ester carboxylesterase